MQSGMHLGFKQATRRKDTRKGEKIPLSTSFLFAFLLLVLLGRDTASSAISVLSYTATVRHKQDIHHGAVIATATLKEIQARGGEEEGEKKRKRMKDRKR
mmetsp:Transcript_49840/g.128237  ORF Transcript_49840/g.128237 Transcript_49840/m.128237 type:complete len:100 (+) Transcript_49840:226-525(+)